MKDWLPIVSVVIAQFVLVGLYFVKQYADDKRRWNEKRLEAYKQMSRAARDAYYTLVRHEDGQEPNWEQYDDAMIRAEDSQLDIVLLSSLPVRERAELLMITMSIYPDSRDAPDLNVPPSELASYRSDFESAVRAELRIKTPIGYKPQLEPLSLRQTKRFFRKAERKAKRKAKKEARGR